MKKIIYAIVSALIISVILALVFPTWFLREDAQWTHLNDTARVDIFFDGKIKNGRVKVEGTDLRITYPQFLSNARFQGATVEFPVSYRAKSYRMKLTPQADEWGDNTTLIIKFMGKCIQYEGKRRPAWVTFRSINLNRHVVTPREKVWHNQPFILKYPPLSSSELTLTFDVHKSLGASDFSYTRLTVVFVLSLMLCLFHISLKTAACRAIEFIDRRDIVKVLSDGYLHIDSVYRRSFWIILGVLCFAFGLHAIWFMWGNHDWSLLDHTHHWLRYAGMGRYMLNSVKMLFAQGVYLPLIYDLVTFIALAINAVLLCKYWRLRKRVINYVLCGLLLTAQPFTLCMLYYVHMIPEVFIGVTCVLAALLTSEKIAMTRDAIIRKIVYSLIAIILLNFALAVYPVLISTIAVTFVGRLLIQSFDWDGSRQQLKSYIGSFMISMIHIVLGIVLYKLVIAFVFPVVRFYNTETLPLAQVPERLGVLFKQSFHQLYEYNMPFLSQWVLWVFLSLTIVLVLYICSVGSIKQKIARLFLLFSSLFATQTAMIIAKIHMIEGRVELFGLVFFEVLVMVLVITRFRRLRNLWIIAGISVAFTSVINDLDALRVWKLGFDAEKMLWNRVLARMEIQKSFDPTKNYDVVQIGWPIAMRPRYYTGTRVNFGADDILNYSYDQKSNTLGALEFYYPTRFRSGKRYSAHHRKNPEYISRLRRLYQAGVLQKAEAWPKPNGLIVWKDIILFVTDGKELDNYKRKFERELGKK